MPHNYEPAPGVRQTYIRDKTILRQKQPDVVRALFAKPSTKHTHSESLRYFSTIPNITEERPCEMYQEEERSNIYDMEFELLNTG